MALGASVSVDCIAGPHRRLEARPQASLDRAKCGSCRWLANHQECLLTCSKNSKKLSCGPHQPKT